MAKTTKNPVEASPTIVAQHNHLVRSYLSFGTLEARIFTNLLSNINRNDTEFTPMEVRVSDLVEYRPSSKTYALVKEAVESLHNKKLNLLDTLADKNSYHSVNFFEEMEYQAGSGVVKVTFSKKVMPYLLQLKENFTLAEIGLILQLKSGYAHRLYWLLKSYEFKGVYVEEIEEFKKMIAGEKNKYPRYFDFKKYVITPTFEEVSKVINVSLEEVRSGRNVTHLKFTYSGPVKQIQPPSPQIDLFSEERPLTSEEKKAYDQMTKYGLSKKQAAWFVRRLEPVIIHRTIHSCYLIDRSKVANPAAHIYDNLKKLVPNEKAE